MRPETKRTRRSAPAASRVAASDAVRPTVTLAIRPGASRPGWLPVRPRDVSELETEADRERARRIVAANTRGERCAACIHGAPSGVRSTGVVHPRVRVRVSEPPRAQAVAEHPVHPRPAVGAVSEPWQQREPHGVVIRILLLGCDALEDPEEAARWRGGPLLGHHARQLRVVRDPLSTPRTTPPPSPAMTPAVLVPLIGSLPVISSDCRLCEATRLAPGQVPDLDQPTHGVGECVAQRAGLEVEFGAGR
jgi:hypothetical protein